MTIIVIVDVTGVAIGIVAAVFLAVVTVTETGAVTVTFAVIVYGKNTVTANVFYSYCCCYPLV